MQTKTAPVAMFKAAADAPAGTFEAIVSVFGNVDKGGDRVVAGAFADSLDQWRKSGDPIPVIFSHQWGDLHAHIGIADPADVRELLPGDELLPTELKDHGGLYAKMQLDVDDADSYAPRVGKLLTRRSLKQFSFAYNIGESAEVTEDETRINELKRLDLLEIGPTLLGMNPATELLSAKALGELSIDELLEYQRPPGALSEAKADELIEAIRSLPSEIAAIVAGDSSSQAHSSQAPKGDPSGDPKSVKSETVAARAALELAEIEADAAAI